jgi:hypothetical protein
MVGATPTALRNATLKWLELPNPVDSAISVRLNSRRAIRS